MNERIMSVAVGVAGIAFLLGVLAGTVRYSDSPHTSQCFEDSVVVWTGEAHDLCWPTSDLWMLMEIESKAG